MTVAEIVRLLRRRAFWILAFSFAAAAVAWVLVKSLEPVYRAEASILLDVSVSRVSGLVGVAAPAVDSATRQWSARSQVAIVLSDKLAKEVIEANNLAHHAMFQPRPSLAETRPQHPAWRTRGRRRRDRAGRRAGDTRARLLLAQYEANLSAWLGRIPSSCT